MVGIVTIFITRRNLVHLRPFHLLEDVLLVRDRPFIHKMGKAAFDDAESLANYPHQKKTGIRSDLCPFKINGNGIVEIRVYRIFLRFYVHEHCLNPRRFRYFLLY
jgi:hypothetical protein